MTKKIEINTYINFPNMEEMNAQNYSNYDYIALSFEISLQDINVDFPKKTKEQNVILFSYLFVDQYMDEKKENKRKTSINFDYLSTEECGTYCRPIYESTKKRSVSSKNEKSFRIDNSELLKMKKIEQSTDYLACENMSEILRKYLKENVYRYLDSVEPYLKQNGIEYRQKDLNDFVKISKKEAKKLFNVPAIIRAIKGNTDYNGDIERDIQTINSVIQANYLAENLPTKSLPNKKIKI